MKVTPLEIRQKTFEKKLRGFDKDEVLAYLNSLSVAWERNIEETKELKLKLETAEKDVARLREVETSLFKTLKTAEDTGANVIDQAKQSAELQVKEAQMQADAILNDAKTQAKNMIEEAEENVKIKIEAMKDAMRILESDIKVIEHHRDNLLIELKSIASDTINRVEKLQEKKATRPDLESETKDPAIISFEQLDESAEQPEESKEAPVEDIVEGSTEKQEESKPESTEKLKVDLPAESEAKVQEKNEPKDDQGSDVSFFDKI